jgi:serine/threonine protein kinase
MLVEEQLLKPDDVVRGRHSKYTILNLIGRGGMGVVYRVRRVADGTIWALKEMRPPPYTPEDEVAENRTLFEQEAELMGMLSHPNIPVLADRFEHEGRPVMVMEFVPGRTLEERIHEANAPLLEQQVLGYGVQLCRVLHYLHTRKPSIIYRDLKPPNIMLTPGGVMKLIDFGVARTFKVRKTKDTIAMGSAGYAPPEQYGKGQTDARSDIYALGATLLHLLTNMPPVPLQTPSPGHIRTINPSVDEQTEQVIIKAMSLERDQRYASCEEMEQALMRCLDAPYVDPTAQVSPPPAVPAEQPGPPAEAPAVPAPASNHSPASPPPAMHPTAPTVAPYEAPADGPTCSNCGYVNKEGARFCARCGTPLVSPPQARLVIKSPRSSWEMTIDSDLPCRIGRRDPSKFHYPELDLAEHDRGIASRHHATIQRSEDFYTLTDLGSTNGTYINGTRIAPFDVQRLRHGDRIKIGEVEIIFRWA